MSAFLYGVILEWKLDFRNRLITYYIVPLVFFGFMGGIFSSINPTAKDTLIQSMTVFGITMGAILGSPTSLVEVYGSEIKKAYKVGGIPLWTASLNNFIAAFIHLFIFSLCIFFIAPIAFHAKVPENIILYFTWLALVIAVSLLVGTVIGLFIKSNGTVAMVSQCIFLPSLMLSGIMFPTKMLPKVLENVGKLFPATWGYNLLISRTEYIKFLIPLGFIAIVMFCLSAYKLSQIEVN